MVEKNSYLSFHCGRQSLHWNGHQSTPSTAKVRYGVIIVAQSHALVEFDSLDKVPLILAIFKSCLVQIPHTEEHKVLHTTKLLAQLCRLTFLTGVVDL